MGEQQPQGAAVSAGGIPGHHPGERGQMGSEQSPLWSVGGGGACGRLSQDQALPPAPLPLGWLNWVSTISSHHLSTVFELAVLWPPRRSPPCR